MKQKLIIGVFLLQVFIVAIPCRAFETETHALITRQAYAESVLAPGPGNTPSLTLVRFGLDRLDVTTPFNIYWRPPSFNEVYYLTGAQEGVRVVGGEIIVPPDLDEPEAFERCQMQSMDNTRRIVET